MTSGVRITVTGAVQGVGFRPYVFRKAIELGVAGHIYNASSGVVIEAQGQPPILELFIQRLYHAPAPIRVTGLRHEPVSMAPTANFSIAPSQVRGPLGAAIPLDAATCDACLADLFDPNNRRYRYPFVTCAQCGPRFSILQTLPFDRGNTSMVQFAMCQRCNAEYRDPADRRFHAQTVSCPHCGPQLVFRDASGRLIGEGDVALARCLTELSTGKIVAIKGIGGFQLMVDPANFSAVKALRRAKGRPTKPFVVMLVDEAMAETYCHVNPAEAELLRSPAAPIVLLSRRDGIPWESLCDLVSPDSGYLGCMLPNSPLHHLLLRDWGRPVIVTSGNRGGEPLCKDESEVFARLAGVTDYVLTHNRTIVHRIDDSIVRVADCDHRLTLRLGRGCGPLVLETHRTGGDIFAVGGHDKNSFAVASGGFLTLSQHVGDLTDLETQRHWQHESRALRQMLGFAPVRAIADQHPDYESSGLARGVAAVDFVQHHQAHVLACVAEHAITGAVLGVAWDGAGFGGDGTLWGGEFLAIDGGRCERVGHLRQFPLVGGEAAARAPRLAALGLLSVLRGADVWQDSALLQRWNFSQRERNLLAQALERGVNVIETSSVGRLFDAVASLTGLCQVTSYSEQAPMLLESVASRTQNERSYEFPIVATDGVYQLDWGSLIKAIWKDVETGVDPGDISRGFHRALANGIVVMARELGFSRIALSGGVFCNAVLVAMVLGLGSQRGIQVYVPSHVPPNDGGLALGQAFYGLVSAETLRSCA